MEKSLTVGKKLIIKFYHFTEKDNQDSAGQLIRNQIYQDGDILVTIDQEGIVTRSTEKRQTFVKDALGNSYYVTNDGTFLTGPQVVMVSLFILIKMANK